MASSPPLDDFPMFESSAAQPEVESAPAPAPAPKPSSSSLSSEPKLLSTIPIHISTGLGGNLHLHQFPLLTRPLSVPPSARLSGKRVKVRVKPDVGVWEMHLPVDRRKEVWNSERATEHGAAREEGDREERRVRDEAADEENTNNNPKVKKEPASKSKVKKEEKGGGGGRKTKKGANGSGKKGKGKMRAWSDSEESGESDLDAIRRGGAPASLGEVRMKSESVSKNGDYFVGVMRDGRLHLHPIAEIQQFRPTLTYLDVLTRQKAKPAAYEEEDDDNADAVPAGKAREVVVSARGGEQSGGGMGQMTGLRREMIATARKEQKEAWVDLEWFDEADLDAGNAQQGLFSTSEERLKCTSSFGDILTGIDGLDDA